MKLIIESLAGGGRGVGRAGGRVWFVQGGLPGDVVLARPTRERARYVEGVVTEMVEPSPWRRDPPCPFQVSCGGCPWMPLDEYEQERWKGRIVGDALARIGSLPGIAVDEVISSPRSLGYRGKMEFMLSTIGDGSRVIGLNPAGGRGDVVDVPDCMLQSLECNKVLEIAREYLLDPSLPDGDLFREGDDPTRLMIRRSFRTGEIQVALRGRSCRSPRMERFARFIISRCKEITGVVCHTGIPGRRGGTRSDTLAGRDWIEEGVGETAFRLPAQTFFQVNPEAARNLVALVEEFSEPAPGMEILDLYGGVGVYAFALSGHGARVTVCEADTAAVRCGRETARRITGPRPRFEQGDVYRFLSGITERHGHENSPEVILANPPRGGCGPGVAGKIASLKPRRIVMVSCDPATLARDLKSIVGRGYRVDRVVPLDLFPQTPHVETVVLLTGED